jgi:hypothetical protein
MDREGAKALGLSGNVTDEPFEALRTNRRPKTGEHPTALANSFALSARQGIAHRAPPCATVLIVGNPRGGRFSVWLGLGPRGAARHDAPSLGAPE